MRKDLTEVIFLIDRSGSMCFLVEDTIGGFNSFIDNQKTIEGEARLTTVLFDNEYEVLHDHQDLSKVEHITHKEYFPRGATALLDAIGKTITSVGNRLNQTPEEERPANLILVITTDGAENASVEFSREQIKKMVEHQQEKYNWNFLFLGANIDSFGTASSLGVSAKGVANYSANGVGTASVYSSVTKCASALSRGIELDGSHLEDVK